VSKTVWRFRIIRTSLAKPQVGTTCSGRTLNNLFTGLALLTEPFNRRAEFITVEPLVPLIDFSELLRRRQVFVPDADITPYLMGGKEIGSLETTPHPFFLGSTVSPNTARTASPRSFHRTIRGHEQAA
jgi:hypothetical protein